MPLSLQGLFGARYGSLQWPPWKREIDGQVPVIKEVIGINNHQE
jgi:hypothetical protein